MRRLLAAALLLTLPIGAEARCRVTWVDGYQQQLCDNTFDVPGVNLPGLEPLPNVSLPPLPPVGLPPLGTSSCRQAQVAINGRYEWRTVCQ